MPKKNASIRDGFGQALLELGHERSDVVALCADLRESVRMHHFAEAFPERFFEAGVAEQNLVGMAAGFAKEGFVAFAGSFAAFSPGRTFDQIRVNICLSRLSVVIVGGHAGLTVGEDGATHQMLEDLALMRVLPNMRVLIPADFSSAVALTKSAAQHPGPTYLRLSRASGPDILPPHAEPDTPLRLQVGQKVTLISVGILTPRVLELAKLLEENFGIRPQVLVLLQLKPLNIGAWIAALQPTQAVIVVEEHQEMGGAGSAIAEVLGRYAPRPLEIIGVSDRFGRSGPAEELLDAYGFSPPALLERVREFLVRHQVL